LAQAKPISDKPLLLKSQIMIFEKAQHFSAFPLFFANENSNPENVISPDDAAEPFRKKKKNKLSKGNREKPWSLLLQRFFFLFLPLCFLLNKSPEGLFGEIKIKV